jgi:hypothetical protein
VLFGEHVTLLYSPNLVEGEFSEVRMQDRAPPR